MKRDITEQRFKELCEANGFKSEGFWGYYSIGNGVSVSVLNAGERRRDQFAYLLKMKQAELHKPKRKVISA